MDGILREMREVERASRLNIQPGPKVAHYALDATNWAEDFLREEPHVIPGDLPSASGWSQEFLDHPGYMGDGENFAAEWDTQWDSLTSHIDNPGLATPGALSQTAGEIIDRMKDPKFAQSEVILEIHQYFGYSF